MPIRFRCKCGKGFKVADKFAGKRVKCPACGIAMVVPVPDVQPASESPRPEGELALEMEAPPSPPGDAGTAPAGELSMEEPPSADGAQEGQPSAEAPAAGILESGSPEEAIPLDGDAQAAQEAEKACPKCGAPAPGNAVICTECGGRFDIKEDEAAALPVPTTQKNPMKLLVIGAVGVVVLAGLVFGLMTLLKKPAEDAGPTSSAGGDAADSARSELPKSPPLSGPEPPVTIEWEGFADPALHTRDKLLALGESLTAFKEGNSRFPADLAELGMSDTAGIVYLGRDDVSLERFHALAHASEADAAGHISVLFSDGTVRVVAGKDLDSVLLTPHSAGLMTKPDAALLSQLGPQLRVNNPRFSELEVSVDDHVLGSVVKGASQTFAVAEGSHELVFSARGKQSEKIGLTCDAGVLYEYTFHRHQDLPAIPTFEYRNALTQSYEQRYRVVKNEEQVTGLSGEDEVVHFTAANVRNAVSRNYRSLNGWIQRQHLKIEGLQGKPILVSAYGCLEEGVVRYASGQEIIYRRTALGTLATRERPNIEVASLACFPEEPKWGEGEFVGPEFDPSRDPYQGPYGRPPTMPRGRSLRPPAGRSRRPISSSRTAIPPRPMRGRMTARDAEMMQGMMRMGIDMGVDRGMGMEAMALEIEIPDMLYVPGPDCEALAAGLRQSASGITPLLVRQIDGILTQQAPVEDVDRPGRRSRGRRESSQRRPPGGPPGYITRNADTYGSRGRGMGYEEQIQARPLGYSEPLSDESIADLIATLAVHGDSSALLMLSRLAQEMKAELPGYGELLIALARCGGGQALLQIKSAADKSPQQAAIALAMVDTTAARKALRAVTGKWTVRDVVLAVEEWPDVAGVRARAVFMDTLIAAQPTLLEKIPALNALLELDPYALERILLERLLEPDKLADKGLSDEMEDEEDDRPPPPEPHAMRPGMMLVEVDAAAPPSWQILAKLKNTKALEYMISLLNGNNVEKKRDAMGAIAQIHDESFIQTAAALLKDTDRDTRKHAVRMLVGVGTAEAVNALNEAMSADLLFAAIPGAASELAGKAGYDMTVALLAKMLDISVDEAFTLPALEDEGRQARGRPSGRSSRGRPSRGRPSRGRPGMPPGYRRMDDMPGMPPMVSDDATPQVIMDALIELRASSEAVHAVIEKARASENPGTRVAAYKAMAALPLPGASEPARGSVIRGIFKLATAARSRGIAGTAGVSATAVTALSLEAAKDSDPKVRAAGIAMMKGRSAEEAAPVLDAGLADASPEARVAVMEMAATIEGDSLHVTQILAAGLNDSDPKVIVAAALAAAQRKQSGLGQALVAALNEPVEEDSDLAHTQTLKTIVETCGALSERATMPSLALLLGHKQPEIREAAARALGEIGDDNAVYALRTMLKDKDQAVKAASILALSRMNSPDAISVSLEALGSKDLPWEIHLKLLTRLVAECSIPGAYADWLDRSSRFDDAGLQTLVEIAYEQRPELRSGFIYLAKKYLGESDRTVRSYAAQMLACYGSDPEARDVLLDAFVQDATGISEPVARTLSQIDDPEMLTRLWKLYRKIIGPSRTARGARPHTLRGISQLESRLLTLAIVDGVSNVKSNESAQMLWRIGRGEERPEIVVSVLKALPDTESPLVVKYFAEAGTRTDKFRVEAATGLARVGRLSPREAKVALSKIARSHASRAAAIAADALEDLAEISPSKTR